MRGGRGARGSWVASAAVLSLAMLALAVLARAVLALAVLAIVTDSTAPSAHTDLHGARDVERAFDALLDEDDDARRARAATWLATHGPDELTMEMLLDALHEEEVASVASAIVQAIARRARPSDAAELLELDHHSRPSIRAMLALTLAQLGAEESDAWLVERLSSPTGTELRAPLQQVAEIARQRRDALLPRVLDAIAERQPPHLITWLASLDDERARGTLLTVALASPGSRVVALEGLARLGPDPETARRLLELVTPPAVSVNLLAPAPSATPRPVATPSPELVRAVLAADPSADVAPFLEATNPTLRVATLEALVERAPERALALLGMDPSAIAEADRSVLLAALAHPSAALVPWFERMLRDEVLARAHASRALEALVLLPVCALTLDDSAIVDDDEARLAHARLARSCPTRALDPAALEGLSPEATLHVRAIAGHDVRDAIAALWPLADAPADRLTLAHAWLASVEPDPRVIELAAGEDDADVFAVLVLAMSAHGLSSAPSRWAHRIEPSAQRLAAIEAMRSAPSGLSPQLSRSIDRASVDRDPAVAALALHVAEGHRPSAATARLCQALESESRTLARAARHLLLARSERPPCVASRARIDAELRAALLEVAPVTPAPPLVVHVVSNVGAVLQRVSIETSDGRTSRIRPPADGLVLIPGLDGADVHLRLDAEPEASGGDR